jgi:hypothetical protein
LRDRYSSEHLAIIASIEAHDLKGAENAMGRHIQGISCSIGPAISRSDLTGVTKIAPKPPIDRLRRGCSYR